LIPNGGFELISSRGTPVGWWFNASSGAVVRLSNESPHSGKWCLYFKDDDAENWADCCVVFPYVQQGYEYVVTLWVKHTAKSRQSGRLYYQWRGEKGKLAVGRFDLPRSTEWKY